MGCLGMIFFAVVALVALLVWQIPHAGPVLAVALVAGAIWLYRIVRDTPSADSEDDPSSGAAESLSDPDGETGDDAPPRAIRLASRGRQGVAGEAYYTKHIARVVGRRRVPSAGDWDSGLHVIAYLDRQPTSKHDRNAVRVRMLGGGKLGTVGYLPATVAPAWQPAIRGVEQRGAIASCRAAIYRQHGGRQNYVIVLRLSPPEAAVFDNDLPDGAAVIAAERECAVTGEQNHQEAVGEAARMVWATLHPATVQGGKFAGEATIEVRIDGQRVGALTAAQGQRYAPVLSTGSVVACEAEVFQGSRNMEVRLFLPRVD